MAIEAARLKAVIEADAGQLESELQRASKSLEKFASSSKKMESSADGISTGVTNASNALGKFSTAASVAIGTLSAQLIGYATKSLVGLGREALDAYASYERLGMSLQSLIAREALASGRAKDMASALQMVGPEARQTLQWLERLAVESPFTSKGVSDAYRMAMGYGFTTKEAKRLTQAMIDFASGSGTTEDAMSRIALALGQIKARGRLAGQEVMQLTEVGIPVDQILARAFNKTTQEIIQMREKGLIPAEQAIEAIIQTLERDFGGAAKRQTETFSGLISTLQDMKEIGLREFFAGTFEAVKPMLVEFTNVFQDAKFRQGLRDVGVSLGETVKSIATSFGEIARLAAEVPSGVYQAVAALTGLAAIAPSVISALNGIGMAIAALGGGAIAGTILGGIGFAGVATAGILKGSEAYNKALNDLNQNALQTATAWKKAGKDMGALGAELMKQREPLAGWVQFWEGNYKGARDTAVAVAQVASSYEEFARATRGVNLALSGGMGMPGVTDEEAKRKIWEDINTQRELARKTADAYRIMKEQYQAANITLTDTSKLFPTEAAKQYELALESTNEKIYQTVQMQDLLKTSLETTLTDAFSKYANTMQDLEEAYKRRKIKQDELNQAQKDAVSTLQRTTSEYLYQKTAMALNADAALDLANRLNLVDQTSFAVGKAIQSLREMYDKNRDGVIGADENTQGYINSVAKLRDYIAGLQSKNVQITMNDLQPFISQLTELKRQQDNLSAFQQLRSLGTVTPSQLTTKTTTQVSTSQTITVTANTSAAEQAIVKLKNEIQSMPGAKSVNISTPGATEGIGLVGALRNQIQNTPDTKSVNVSTPGAAEGIGLVGALRNQINSLHDKTVTITTIHRNITINETQNNPTPHASGGPVKANTTYLVGELGPELFVPSVNGTIIPNRLTQKLLRQREENTKVYKNITLKNYGTLVLGAGTSISSEWLAALS